MAETQDRDANHLRWQVSTVLGIRVSGPEYQKMEHRETLWWGCCCKKKNMNTVRCQKGGTLPLTRAPLTLQIVNHLLGGGESSNTPPPPSISAPIGRREKRKNVRKLVKNDYETISVNFSFKSKLWQKNGKIFEFFAIVKHRFGKPPLSWELLWLGQIWERHSKDN